MQSLVTFFCAENASKSVETNGLSSGLKFHCQAVKLLLQAAQFKTVRNYVGGHMGGM